MAVNLTNDAAEDATAAAWASYDVDAAQPWYRSKRTWAAATIAAVLVVEAMVLARARDPLAAERRAVAAFDDKRKTELEESWRRFEKLKPEERDRIRELHAAVEADAASDELRRTLDQYQHWKAGLSPQQSAALVGLAPQQRIEEVRKLAGEQRAVAAKTLSNEDGKVIVAWLERQVDAVQDKLMETMPAEVRERFDHLDSRQRNWGLIMSLVSFRGPSSPSRLDLISLKAVADLRAQLSPAAQKTFDATTPDARKQLLGDWIRQAVYRSMPYREGGGYAARVEVPEKDLQQFFDELSEPERNRYMALPREEMQSQLRREYLRRKGIWKEPSFGGRPGFGRGTGMQGGPNMTGGNRPPFGSGSQGGPRDGRPNGPDGRPNGPDGQSNRPGNPPEPRDGFRPNEPRPNIGPQPNGPPQKGPPPTVPKSTV